MDKITKTQRNPMVGLLIITITVIIIIAGLTGCEKRKDPIKVGLSVTLTGRSSNWGTSSRNAITLAVEQMNNAGGINGRPVELIIKDDKGKKDVALQVDKEMIDSGVVAILGHHLSTLSVHVVPLMNEKNVLMISCGTSTTDLTGLDDNLIRLLAPVDLQAPLFADLAFNHFKMEDIAVVYDLSNPKFTVSFYKSFAMEFGKLGGRIPTAITFNPSKKISAPDIAKELIASKAEGVVLLTNGIDAALISQHLRNNGSRMKVYATGWPFADPGLIKTGGQAVEGVVSVNQFNGESTDKDFLKFKGEYEGRFEKLFNMHAQIAYEAAQVLFSGVSKTDNPHKLKEAILRQKVFTGLDSDISIDKYGDPVRTMYIQEIRDGKIRTIGTIEPKINN